MISIVTMDKTVCEDVAIDINAERFKLTSNGLMLLQFTDCKLKPVFYWMEMLLKIKIIWWILEAVP